MLATLTVVVAQSPLGVMIRFLVWLHPLGGVGGDSIVSIMTGYSTGVCGIGLAEVTPV